jgi:hypothetical protein
LLLWQLSLFLAIMLSFFGELTPSDKRIARLRWRLSIRFVRHSRRCCSLRCP